MAAATTGDSSPEGKVREWLRKQGYPLEFRTARAFRDAGFLVYQGLAYRDADTGKMKEIDVVAVLNDDRTKAHVEVLVECKSTSNPWLILPTAQRLSPQIVADLVMHGPKVREDTIQGMVTTKPDSLFLDVPEVHGFSLVETLVPPDDDRGYALLSGLAAAVRGRGGELARLPNVIFAAAVVRSPMYVLEFDPSEESVLRRTDRERIVWHGAAHWQGSPIVIDIVSGDHLPEFARQARISADYVLGYLAGDL